ncbi:methyl-accepting chemotaxis protein (MCP) signaling protein [Paraburkholderia sp. BL23I1N1]|nr:methyl-accepting chemotaxis protein (MCP) signaling protein [Paraburkholderia sp. BL23I1N1]
MGEIKRVARHVSDFVREIAVASEEQSRRIDQAHLAVIQMDLVTQQNAALVEQVAAASQSLEEQATQLNGAVSAFKLTATSDSGDPVRAGEAVATMDAS